MVFLLLLLYWLSSFQKGKNKNKKQKKNKSGIGNSPYILGSSKSRIYYNQDQN